MGADDYDALEYCSYLWEEYRYRHDLVWGRTFGFTTAIVLISVIPYVQQNIARMLGPLILIAPLLATILAGFVLVVMRNELRLLDKIKKAYRKRQNELLDKGSQHDLSKKSYFSQFVLLYLGSLAALSLANGLIIALVWLPQL